MNHRAPTPPAARRPGRPVRSCPAPPPRTARAGAYSGLRRTAGALAGLLFGALVEASGWVRFAGRLLVLITAGLAGEAVWAALRASRSVGRNVGRGVRRGVRRCRVLGRGAVPDGARPDAGSR